MNTRFNALFAAAGIASLVGCAADEPVCSSQTPADGCVEGRHPAHSGPPDVGASTFAEDARVSGEILAAAGRVYWVDRAPRIRDSIRVAPAGGGPSSALYTAPNTVAAIEYIAADADTLYWSEVSLTRKFDTTSTIKAMPLAGGPSRVLCVSAEILALELAVGGGRVYFGSEFGGLGRVAASGGDVTRLRASFSGPVAANDDGACWERIDATGASILCEASGAAAHAIVASHVPPGPLFGPLFVALSGADVVWAAPAPDGEPGFTLSKAPTAGGPVSKLGGALTDVTALAADATDVYALGHAAGGEGVLVRAPLAGGAASTLAHGLDVGDFDLVAAAQLAIDDEAIYWTDPANGLVLRASK